MAIDQCFLPLLDANRAPTHTFPRGSHDELIEFVSGGDGAVRACRCGGQSMEPLLILLEVGVALHIRLLNIEIIQSVSAK